MKVAAAVLAALFPFMLHAAEPKFAAAVEAEKYPSVSAPEQAPALRWDFSAKRDHTFRFEQVTEARSRMLDRDSDNTMNGKGMLIVRSNGDGTAKLVFDNLELAMSTTSDGKPQTSSQTMPTTVAGTMRENGAITTQQQALQILFPLPPGPLAVGEKVDVPFDLPFNAAGSVLQAKGITHLTHAGYAMLGKRLCARLESRVELGKLDVPEELPGKYELTLTATGVYFFDVHERRFVRGVSASRTAMEVDAPAPRFGAAGADAKVPERMKVSMASDDRITLAIAE